MRPTLISPTERDPPPSSGRWVAVRSISPRGLPGRNSGYGCRMLFADGIYIGGGVLVVVLIILLVLLLLRR